MNSATILAQAWRIGGLGVPNRVVMAPMSTHQADGQGRVTGPLIEFLERRARGGCGMIIVESAAVDFGTGGVPGCLRLDHEDCVDGLRELVGRLHRFPTRVVAQLWHAGPRAQAGAGLPLSPSGPAPGLPPCRPMSRGEIAGLVEAFAGASDRAVRAGCDAVEIHAAHGYLLHGFLAASVNRREDDYGGGLAGRFLALREIRAHVGDRHPDLPVILRLSMAEEDEPAEWAACIHEAGYDAVDLRTGFSSQSSAQPVAGYTLGLAGRLRAHLKRPLMTGGRLLTPDQAMEAIAACRLDGVVLGRALLADPDWAGKAIRGEPAIPCLYDCAPSCYGAFKAGEVLRCLYHGRAQ